jgi:sigma-B regulation protein RsbU (phosphoserine phosphatase)
VNGRNLGILNVAGPDWESFSEPALALLTNVGSQMGAALERARLFDLLQERHIHQQASLLELSNQLLSRLELDDLLAYLTAEVRRLLQADACAILLPDEQDPGQLSFQAASGWQADPVSTGRRLPNDQRSLAGQAVHSQQLLQLKDLQEADDRLSWRPDWLRSEGFQGHAVIPLVAAGCSVGVVVIDMRRPRLLNDEEIRFLRLMANQAAIAIEKARLHREELKQQQVERELMLAHQIQRNLLPDSCPSVPGWEFAVSYQAAHQVGGDFYDYFELPGPPGRWGFVIGDATGKGIPAAIQMALSRTVIRTTALAGPATPSEVLCRANELILKDSYAQRFVSAFYGELDPSSGRFIYSNAGHHRPLLIRATGEVQELVTSGTVLGVFDSAKIGQTEDELFPGDAVVLYTDGVTEMMNARREMFGEARLGKTIAAHRTAPAADLLQFIMNSVAEFAGEIAPADDLTLFIIKRKPHENPL